ncbi:6-hydroxymethylpterin diphosphokinase MptE-like protein [Rheinheimera nanhaiensis]|uniref:DUF115 domain-containing protein n=1 Tax=Rheinheimera nanhaiensis E407-8 TaxID=562729 RepID=I1DWM3_9GAMM|nr:6-hydroxymethylpterin diphosphokinase MptE-like protein [Rheinheimera nanhaiensis]GAB58451.1 hypothetical protein RNAN_1423 [Rheinheimera nanhaiensis E407-8]
MLKYINYQLDTDDTRQAKLERDISAQINQRFKANMSAFAQHIPSVVPMIEQHAIQQYSVFCTRQGELNIVDFATGRVWYSETPFAEVADEVQSFCAQAPYIDLSADKAAGSNSWPTEPLPAQVDVVLMFGLGLGYQLNELLQNARVKYLVVYEPNLDTLLCTVQANDWVQLFDTAAALGTQIFLQLGNDASRLAEDLTELSAAAPINRVYVYRHCFHPVMDSVLQHVFEHSGDKTNLTDSRQHFDGYQHFYDYVAERNGNVLGNQQLQSMAKDVAKYERNMAALKQFYPQVYKVISQHQPKHWQLCQDSNHKINLFHSKRNALFYQDIELESAGLVDYFVNHPYQDDVILGQKFSYKLRHYLHFSQMLKIQPILTRALKKRSRLPDTIESLIIFGIASGRHIELLLQQHQVINLYICEPNLDFFFASLYVIDWASIFTQAEEGNKRIYLNLGGDGSQYFYDLMAQFYKVGAYSIANTYLLSAYFNGTMQKTINDLRSELKVVLAIGEYYDHARFGIAHTYHSLKQQHKYLKHDAPKMNLAVRQLPVFIVGNGPSLDQVYDYLKQYQHNVIIISCGTALKALHSHGIKPDFHAEVEQNRATFDWVSQVNDPEYLADISLLSVNGIHPDTASLFKQTLLCFKEGEASTYVFQPSLDKLGYHTAALAYAYPTVTNLVVNFMLKLGQPLLYLFGVDLGYVDVNYHHSRSSAYYKQDGKQIYNYQDVHGGGVVATGNFRPAVFTKPEFDVSRKLLEQAIKEHGTQCEVYNCSDGVKIAGATALQPDNILLPTSLPDKATVLSQLFDAAFHPDLSEQADKIFSKLDMGKFAESLTRWQLMVEAEVDTPEQVMQLIAEQWAFVRSIATSEGNPAYLLFHGSTNYISAVLTKLAVSAGADVENYMADITKVLENWREYIKLGAEAYLAQPLATDQVYVHYLYGKRADGKPLITE